MVGQPGAVLVVDADSAFAPSVDASLGSMARVTHVRTGGEALTRLESDPFDVLVAALDLPDTRGTDLVGEVRRRWPEVERIVLGRDATVARAVEVMQAGATDFLGLPVDPGALARALGNALTRAEHAAELPPPGEQGGLVGQARSLREALEAVRKAAASMATVLVRGETGTGKELVARMVHDLSARREKPLVKVQCSALPDTLLESELFGYEKGAFTGANVRKPGRVELSEGGTLFLDEIGDIALPVQGKLLRLLQDRQYERLGGTKPLTADVRFVAATFRDLESMIEAGQFRRDLFYRLNVVTVWLPPLRARRDDIPELARHFAGLFSREHGVERREFEPEAIDVLKRAPWPGNVRQLENLVHRLVVLGENELITAEAVERELSAITTFDTQTVASRRVGNVESSSVLGPLEDEVHAAERRALVRALRKTAGNRSLAARLLGISRRTLYNKLAEHGIE
jgi:two-component system response regulator AtoC